MPATILKKVNTGPHTTHNGDGRFLKVWRLWSDGRVERTNSRSRYQPYNQGETIPPELVAAAAAAGLRIAPPDSRPAFPQHEDVR